MVAILPASEQSSKAWEFLNEGAAQEHPIQPEVLPESLAEKVQEGTVSIEEIDSVLESSLGVEPILKGFLLLKKADLLRDQGRIEEALQQYDEVLRIHPNSHTTKAQKGLTLIDLGRFDEGIQALQEADSLKSKSAPHLPSYQGTLLLGMSWGALNAGLESILQENVRGLQQSIEYYLSVKERAIAEGLEDWVARLPSSQDAEDLSPEIKSALEELELAVRLLSIKDPFDGFRALAKEVSKVWPKGLSAVDAIREQRDREWNT